MAKHFTPQWKDIKGNVLFFAAENTIFDSAFDAKEWHINQMLWMMPLGLSPAGVLEFEADNGKFQIPHVCITVGTAETAAVFPAKCIEGPLFDSAQMQAQ